MLDSIKGNNTQREKREKKEKKKAMRSFFWKQWRCCVHELHLFIFIFYEFKMLFFLTSTLIKPNFSCVY